MYKLYEFTMPLTAKAKNLLLIIQNVILLKIDILAKKDVIQSYYTLVQKRRYSVLLNTRNV